MSRPAFLPMGPLIGIGEVLERAAPSISRTEASEIAKVHFGIEGRATPMSSERDNNFRISAADGRSFVLKVSHPAEDPTVVDFQVSALGHIAVTDPHLPVPRVVPAASGAATALIGDDSSCAESSAKSTRASSRRCSR